MSGFLAMRAFVARSRISAFGVRCVAALSLACGIPWTASGQDVYTGCLNSGGNISKVAIGTEPLGRCSGNNTEISWGAGSAHGTGGVLLYVDQVVEHLIGVSGNVLEPTWYPIAHWNLPDGQYVDLAWKIDQGPDDGSADCRSTIAPLMGGSGAAGVYLEVLSHPLQILSIAGGTGLGIECSTLGPGPVTVRGIVIRITPVSAGSD